MWAPGIEMPDLKDVLQQNYVVLRECPSCQTLWVLMPLEPFLSFHYMVIWQWTVADFERISGIDKARRLHRWILNEVRILKGSASDQEQEAIRAHDARTSGGFKLMQTLEFNPITYEYLTDA